MMGLQQVGFTNDGVNQPASSSFPTILATNGAGFRSRPSRRTSSSSSLAWDGHDQAAKPAEHTTDAEGTAEFPAPPHGFAVYVPA